MHANFIYATQIIVESLPISSSTHVKLVELLLLRFGCAASPLPPYIDYLLHGPTLLILALFFRRAWMVPLMLLIKPSNIHRAKLAKIISKIFWYTLLATIPPTLFMFGVIKPWLKHTNVYTSNGVLVGGLMVTMLSLLSLRWVLKAQPRTITTSKAFMLGCVQAVALLPGISRFASTYVAGRWLGLSTRRAFEMCFLIEVPLIMGAFLLGVREWLQTNTHNMFETTTVITLLVATIMGYVALWCMWLLAERNRLWIVGWYLAFLIAIILFTLFS